MLISEYDAGLATLRATASVEDLGNQWVFFQARPQLRVLKVILNIAYGFSDGQCLPERIPGLIPLLF
jgi:hypothetical protein